MKPRLKLPAKFRPPPATLLGLALDGSRLEGVQLRRTPGGVQVVREFAFSLTLDPLGSPPELVGREIRNQLDAAGISGRRCVAGLPLKWLLTAQVELPPLAPADEASLLQLELERGFATDAAGLQTASSRAALPGGRKLVLCAGIPLPQLEAWEKVLAAARLRPVSFALGSCALQPPAPDPGVLALVVSEQSVALQVTAGGGVVALRALEGAVEIQNGRPSLQLAAIIRETRVTLGQLPAALRSAVRRIRIFGPRDFVQPLADELELRLESLGLAVELAGPAGAGQPPVSAARALAAQALAASPPPFEFLPPKPSAARQFLTRWTSGRLGASGAAAAGVALLAILLFLGQQIELWHLRSEWTGLRAQVTGLQGIQDQIQQFRPWYDGTCRTLSVLRLLTLAFPGDGSVTAKSIGVRDGSQVNLSGTARDNAALLAMQSRLRAADGVSAVKVDQIRGKAPLQFTFDFLYRNGGDHGN